MKPVFTQNGTKPEISLSVRELCSFVLRRGDIKSGGGYHELINGAAIHRMIQDECRSKDEQYKAEVKLGAKLEFSDFILNVGGRADGVTFDEKEYTVDEIKSVIYPLSLIDERFSRIHLAQAKCYAYMLVKSRNLEFINVKLIYYHVEENETRVFNYCYTASQVTEFFHSLVSAYGKWALLALDGRTKRTEGVKSLRFPFKKAREGQSDLMKECFRAVTHNYNLYVNAPTGIGKTMSALYPSVLSFNKNTDKIFYLTAKTSTQKEAEKAAGLILGENPFFKAVTVTAKGKMCIYPGVKNSDYPCDSCERGIGYYDRINEAIFDVITHEWMITEEVIRFYAEKHKVCPFEFSLDISEWCDLMIGDYNYVFDPRAAIKRYNDTGEKFVLLADEAHNLADRAREMFSAQVKLSDFKKFDNVFRDSFCQLDVLIKKIISFIKANVKQAEEYSEYISFSLPEALYLCINRFVMVLSEAMKKQREVFSCLEKEDMNRLVGLMLDCRHFVNIACEYDKNYVTYVDEGYTIRLYCVQPGERIKRVVDTCGSAVFFSATLLPWDYYLKMLGFDEKDLKYEVPSPFLQDNFLIMSYGLSTKFADRDANINNIARAVKAATSVKTGNYLVFFPSFDYMEKAVSMYKLLYPDQTIVCQKRKMSALERSNFISMFSETPKETFIAFAVMGGIFSEGIDLTGDKLTGVIIIGTGLPSPSVERNAVSQYFNENDESGFNYSFFYPGMNRVFQAMGRVIRTETDRGFALLIDDRFLHEETRETFPPFWQDIKTVSDPKDIYKRIKEFL
ncbi:MAG: ATP-dependent DNA helicase [Clostridia bacterium]|nr:ATP-dependent DNA helicase [Clostridia bacterium]